jgi:DNA-binding NarL/FixJ family response regulator
MGQDKAPIQPVRVLVADDHSVVRKGICALLATEPGIEVVGEAADGQEAISQVDALEPDVLLIDLVMPRMDGLQAIRAILQRHPHARILVLTSYNGSDRVRSALCIGASGVLLKDSPPRDLIRAIHLLSGEDPAHPVIPLE